MAQFLILIYGDEARWDAATAADMDHIDAGHRAFRERAGAAVLSSGQLEPASKAKTVRARTAGGLSVTDGPFAETREVVGGFYVVEAPDLDAAVELAGLLGEIDHDHSAVQVHPLVDHG